MSDTIPSETPVVFPDNLRLGEALGKCRRDVEVTTDELVEATGVEKQQILRLLRGAAVVFEREFARVAKLCHALGIDLGKLVNQVVRDRTRRPTSPDRLRVGLAATLESLGHHPGRRQP